MHPDPSGPIYEIGWYSYRYSPVPFRAGTVTHLISRALASPWHVARVSLSPTCTTWHVLQLVLTPHGGTGPRAAVRLLHAPSPLSH